MLVDYLKFVYKFARVLGQAQRNLLDYEIEGVSLRKLKVYFTTKQEKKGSQIIYLIYLDRRPNPQSQTNITSIYYVTKR